jgi:CRISPR/Cas system-associated protein Csx1
MEWQTIDKLTHETANSGRLIFYSKKLGVFPGYTLYAVDHKMINVYEPMIFAFDEEKEDDEDDEEILDVTHWMNLPEPPNA